MLCYLCVNSGISYLYDRDEIVDMVVLYVYDDMYGCHVICVKLIAMRVNYYHVYDGVV
jgi:hypothetical protein